MSNIDSCKPFVALKCTVFNVFKIDSLFLNEHEINLWWYDFVNIFKLSSLILLTNRCYHYNVFVSNFSKIAKHEKNPCDKSLSIREGLIYTICKMKWKKLR